MTKEQTMQFKRIVRLIESQEEFADESDVDIELGQVRFLLSLLQDAWINEESSRSYVIDYYFELMRQQSFMKFPAASSGISEEAKVFARFKAVEDYAKRNNLIS